MSDRDKLVQERQTAQDLLDDLQFEHFAVSSGIDPKELLEVNAQIAAAEKQLKDCDDALAQLDREQNARKVSVRMEMMEQSQFDEIFEGIVATLR